MFCGFWKYLTHFLRECARGLEFYVPLVLGSLSTEAFGCISHNFWYGSFCDLRRMEKCAHSMLQLQNLLPLFTLENQTSLHRAGRIWQSLARCPGDARVVMSTLGRGVLPACWNFWGSPSVGFAGLGGQCTGTDPM